MSVATTTPAWRHRRLLSCCWRPIRQRRTQRRGPARRREQVHVRLDALDAWCRLFRSTRSNHRISALHQSPVSPSPVPVRVCDEEADRCRSRRSHLKVARTLLGPGPSVHARRREVAWAHAQTGQPPTVPRCGGRGRVCPNRRPSISRRREPCPSRRARSVAHRANWGLPTPPTQSGIGFR